MSSNLAVNFSAMLSQRKSIFTLNLRNSDLIEVLQAYQTHKRKTSPKYRLDAICNNLKLIQELYQHRLFPIDVTDEFYSCFIEWALEKGMMLSTTQNYCGQIRTALTWGSKHGCELSSTYDEFKVKAPEPHRVSLTADEISHIAHFNLDTIKCKKIHRETLDKVRDMFVLSANLFQRYSDMVRISPDNFEHGIYTCVQQKTGGKARVDIKKQSITPALVFNILKKYDYTAPFKGELNHYNKYLHELLSYMGGSFNDELTFEDKVNGEIVVTTKKKWELISSHCARRTAITYAVSNAKTEAEVRRASGHMNRADAFQRYIVYND